MEKELMLKDGTEPTVQRTCSTERSNQQNCSFRVRSAAPMCDDNRSRKTDKPCTQNQRIFDIVSSVSVVLSVSEDALLERSDSSLATFFSPSPCRQCKR